VLFLQFLAVMYILFLIAVVNLSSIFLKLPCCINNNNKKLYFITCICAHVPFPCNILVPSGHRIL
jgi:hypothetical protein